MFVEQISYRNTTQVYTYPQTNLIIIFYDTQEN